MKLLTEKDFATTIAEGVTLVDFYADWCGPCQILAKLMPHLAEKYEDKATIAKVDTEVAFTLTQQYGVTALPTVILFQDGKEMKRMRGLQPPEAYSAAIDALLENA